MSEAGGSKGEWRRVCKHCEAQHMLPLLCRGLNLENIFLDSEENMKVPISRFSRQVVMQDVNGGVPWSLPASGAAQQGSTEPELLLILCLCMFLDRAEAL